VLGPTAVCGRVGDGDMGETNEEGVLRVQLCRQQPRQPTAPHLPAPCLCLCRNILACVAYRLHVYEWYRMDTVWFYVHVRGGLYSLMVVRGRCAGGRVFSIRIIRVLGNVFVLLSCYRLQIYMVHGWYIREKRLRLIFAVPLLGDNNNTLLCAVCFVSGIQNIITLIYYSCTQKLER